MRRHSPLRIGRTLLAAGLLVVCGGLAGRLSERLDALPNARAFRGYGI